MFIIKDKTPGSVKLSKIDSQHLHILCNHLSFNWVDNRPPKSKPSSSMLKEFFVLLVNKIDTSPSAVVEMLILNAFCKCNDDEWRNRVYLRIGLPSTGFPRKRIDGSSLFPFTKQHERDLASLLKDATKLLSKTDSWVNASEKSFPLFNAIDCLRFYTGSHKSAVSIIFDYVDNTTSLDVELKHYVNDMIESEKLKVNMNIPCLLNGKLSDDQI